MKNRESELLQIVNQVLTNRGKSQLESISANLSLRNDIGFDSLDLAELTARIEAKFDIDVFEDGIVSTIGEILNKL